MFSLIVTMWGASFGLWQRIVASTFSIFAPFCVKLGRISLDPALFGLNYGRVFAPESSFAFASPFETAHNHKPFQAILRPRWFRNGRECLFALSMPNKAVSWPQAEVLGHHGADDCAVHCECWSGCSRRNSCGVLLPCRNPNACPERADDACCGRLVGFSGDFCAFFSCSFMVTTFLKWMCKALRFALILAVIRCDA